MVRKLINHGDWTVCPKVAIRNKALLVDVGCWRGDESYLASYAIGHKVVVVTLTDENSRTPHTLVSSNQAYMSYNTKTTAAISHMLSGCIDITNYAHFVGGITLDDVDTLQPHFTEMLNGVLAALDKIDF